AAIEREGRVLETGEDRVPLRRAQPDPPVIRGAAFEEAGGFGRVGHGAWTPGAGRGGKPAGWSRGGESPLPRFREFHYTPPASIARVPHLPVPGKDSRAETQGGESAAPLPRS